MNTISQVLGSTNYIKDYQELISKPVGVIDSVKSEPSTKKVTPELIRVSRINLEMGYIKEPTTFNLVNVTTQLIMSAGRRLDGEKEDVDFMTRFLDNLGYTGGTNLWDPILTLIFKHQIIFGNAYLELITSTKEVNGLKPIVDFDIIDPKMMDYAKDGTGNIVMDMFGRPVGYVQTIPDDFGGMDLDSFKKHKVPKGVALTSNQIYIPNEFIVHFKLHSIGDNYYPLGFIEPAYNSIMYKLKLEEAMINAIMRHGFPILLGKMGDQNHVPTPNQIQDLLNNMKDMTYKHEIAVPYYVDIQFLESKTVTQLREHLEYYTEQMITSFGIPQAIATSVGDSTNRATLTSSIMVLETTLRQFVINTVRQIEYKLFMQIARSHGRKSIPSLEWDKIDTSGLKSEIEDNLKNKPTPQEPVTKPQKPSEYK